jgi:hypothetical protein
MAVKLVLEPIFEALGLVRLRGTIRYPERAFWEAA